MVTDFILPQGHKRDLGGTIQPAGFSRSVPEIKHPLLFYYPEMLVGETFIVDPIMDIYLYLRASSLGKLADQCVPDISIKGTSAKQSSCCAYLRSTFQKVLYSQSGISLVSQQSSAFSHLSLTATGCIVKQQSWKWQLQDGVVRLRSSQNNPNLHEMGQKNNLGNAQEKCGF